MKITKYDLKYRQQVIDLVINIQQNEFNVPVTAEGQPDLVDIPNYVLINKGNFWIAVENEVVMGCIAILDNGNGIGTIRKMFVKSEFRGKEFGVAQKLLDVLWQFAIDNDYKCIYLGTIERLIAARKFYVRNGFELISKADLPPEFPIMVVDDYFYFKKV